MENNVSVELLLQKLADAKFYPIYQDELNRIVLFKHYDFGKELNVFIVGIIYLGKKPFLCEISRNFFGKIQELLVTNFAECKFSVKTFDDKERIIK